MTPKAHPLDVLLIASLSERTEHRQFEQKQIVTLDRALRWLERHKVRRVYMSEPARLAVWPEFLGDLLNIKAIKDGTRTLGVDQWVAEPPSLLELIAALPAENATAGRDYGRGYAQAIRDVTDVITKTLLEAA